MARGRDDRDHKNGRLRALLGKVSTHGLSVISAVLAVLVAFAFIRYRDNLDAPGLEYSERITVPYEVIDSGDNVRIYKLGTNDRDNIQSTLMFTGTYMYVDVSLDGIPTYHLGRPRGTVSSPGNIYNFIDIPENVNTITVTVKTVFPNMPKDVTFAYVNSRAALMHLYRGAMPGFILSLIIAFLGVTLVLYYLITARHGAIRELLYLGLFIQSLGLWALFESQAMKLLSVRHPAVVFSSYTALLMIGLTCVPFVHYFFHFKRDRYCWRILMVVQDIIAVVAYVLQFARIREFKQTAFLFHAIVLLSVAYWIAALIEAATRRKERRRLIVGAVSFVLMLSCTVFNMRNFYVGTFNFNSRGNLLTAAGFLVCGMLMTFTVLQDNATASEEYQQLRFYQSLAESDALSGTYNSHAYEVDCISPRFMQDGATLISLDLNDLKYHNDNFGHETGDRYIRDAAAIIKSVYAGIGRVYRIGGDEFAVIVPAGETVDYDALVKELHRRVTEYNIDSGDIRMGIACGLAVFDKNTDRTLEDTRSRADVVMYDDKSALKRDRVADAV